MIRQILAFLKKDLLIESSYPLSFFFDIFSVLTSVVSYFFIDKLFGGRMAPQLEEFGVNYFSYVLLASAFFSYVGMGLGSFAGQLRQEQLQGTLEAVIAAPTRTAVFLFSMAAWNVLLATIKLLVFIIVGISCFRIDFSRANVFSCLAVLVLAVTSFSALGILSASFVLVTKRGNPLSWLISSAEGLLGGVYFPVTVLPAWLAFFSRLLPITYAIRAIQYACFRGSSITELLPQLVPLLIFAVVLLPVSVKVFSLALCRARANGTLAQF
ncbi:MAG: ABC transporter permease [Candidatus Omnitrophica bacterium]|nr:ABC transporter permease [Candidatus Omnitrophota bacterium]